MILLCSDLDRTLIPNGDQPESPGARPLFNLLASSGLMRMAYVSGRDRKLVQEAIREYQLPLPDFVIGDVGTTLYRVNGDVWAADETWQATIGADWHGREHGDIVSMLDSAIREGMELQPPPKQNRYKVSYFTEGGEAGRSLADSVSDILKSEGVRTNVIWSVDEEKNRGLLDILPASAGKLLAIRFLMDAENIAEEQTVFAGDSGNDLDALTSGLQAILVKNAAADVRREAFEILQEKTKEERLYDARGGKFSLNGNYAAGVLEGLCHFFPDLSDWLQEHAGQLPQ